MVEEQTIQWSIEKRKTNNGPQNTEQETQD